MWRTAGSLTCSTLSAPLTSSQCLWSLSAFIHLTVLSGSEAPPPLFESTYHSSPNAVVSEWKWGVTDDGGRQDGSFILWELFQCQTPVLSVFNDAESRSVFVSEEGKVLRLMNLRVKSDSLNLQSSVSGSRWKSFNTSSLRESRQKPLVLRVV